MKCKVCGKNAESEYCFLHKPKKQLQQRGPTLSHKRLSVGKSTQKKEKTIDMQNLFIDIWKKRSHKSEISGEYLGKEPLSTYFHHILPKSKYPEACLDEENIILLTFLEHEQVEIDMYRYEEVNKRREQLKIKYNLL